MDNGKVLVSLTKTGNKALRWVTKAVTKDYDRPVLQCVSQNGATVACDGYRLHATSVQGLDDGLWNVGKVPAGSTVVEIDNASDAGKYPDWTQIVPDRPQSVATSVQLRVALGRCVEELKHQVAKTGSAVPQVARDADALLAMADNPTEITLNARYLRDAIAMVSQKDGFVRLVIGKETDPVEVFGVIETGAPGLPDTNGYAIVMPIFRDHNYTGSNLDWRPEKTTT